MVEPRSIYALVVGVYGSAKDHMQVVKRLYMVGGKIFYGGERLYCSPFDCFKVPTYRKGSG
jgi:hypothetical protein